MKELTLKLPNSPDEKEPLQLVAHTLNSVECQRPQNKYLKPFKSRAELGGQLDPRINKGGRPKIVKEETAKWLEETDAKGVTNARKMVEAMGALAQKQLRHSVSAFREIRQIVESVEGDAKVTNLSAGGLNESVLRMVQRLAEK
jgi:hypothetical protein